LNDAYYYCKAGATPDMSHPTMSMVLGKGDALGTGEANLQGCITDLVIDGQAMYFPSNSGTKVDFMKCVSDMLPDVKPCADNGDCGDNGDCQIDMANYSAKCTCDAGYKGTLCETADMCGLVTDICGVADAVETCINTKSDPFYECKCNTRYKLDKTSTCVMDKCYDCNLAVADGHASICQYDTTTEVAQCTCTEGWQGETCGAEAAKQKSSTQTTLIIVVVALLVLMVVLITVIFTVRRCNRKNQGEGTYSPNKAELEMGATPPAKGDNIYKNSEVIENVNAESKLFETDDANIDTSYNIYNINAEVSPTPAENGVKAEENVYDVPDSPAPVPTYDDIVAAPVVEEM